MTGSNDFVATLSLALGVMLASAVAGGIAPARAAQAAPPAAAPCGRSGPALLLDVADLKDRAGHLTAELYPANDRDFLKPAADLLREGKTFVRVDMRMPAQGPARLCVPAPRAGRYSLVVIHYRTASSDLNVWKDGVGLPLAVPLRISKPHFSQALVDVGTAPLPLRINMQYMRGLRGFYPAAP